MRAASCLLAATAMVVAGCGSKDKREAAAEQESCAAMPKSSGPDDVIGIRVGLDLPTVKKLLKCRNGGFHFDEDGGGFPLPSLPDGRRPVSKLVAERGAIAGCDPKDPDTIKACVDPDASFTHVDERVHVYFAGLPGQEKVIAVMREESFPDDGKRQDAAIERDLLAKYGTQPDRGTWAASGGYFGSMADNSLDPDRNAPFAAGSNTRYAWLLDGRGQRMSPQNPDFMLCRDASGFGSDSPSHLRAGCHRTVTAWITTARDKPGVADGYGVAFVDQEAASQAIDRTTAQVNALTEAQRQREQQRAQANGGATAL